MPEYSALTLTLSPADSAAGLRLDKWLSGEDAAELFAEQDAPPLTRSAAARILEEGNASSGGKVLPKNYKLRGGEQLTLTIPAPKEYRLEPQNIPIHILYEDEHLLVVDKPKGMVVHPAPGNPDGTLVNALLYACQGRLSGINGELRPGIVHRIDKDTSGLLVCAKTDRAHGILSEAMARHDFHRCYEAVVYGKLKEPGTVHAPIARHPTDRKRMAIVAGGRDAVTHYSPILQYQDFCHAKMKLETGRTHQIRVHMAHIGHPVAGDPVYGPKKVIARLAGQCLHARELGFVHPITGEYMEFTSPLPEYFTSFLSTLKKEQSL
ncbi:MAG: RluA family pseudouridine synthase [Oscillospiraceae bacterium]|nr:RluA family pseudouridine synthase [Oscillospiraceae bacterium]